MRIKGVFLSEIFTAVLFFTSSTVLAGTYSGGNGSAGDPYQIANLDDWQELRTTSADWGNHFILTADINLTGQTFTQAPIAPDTTNTGSSYEGTAFTGTLDGRGYAIKNLRIETSADKNDYLGLFGYLGLGAAVSNLTLDSIYISGGGDNSFFIGGLAGYSKATVSNCHVTGIVASIDYTIWVGGLIGQSDTPIIRCSAYVNVTVWGDAYAIGGLVGQNSGITQDCFALGNVTDKGGFSYYFGGLAGDNDRGTIKNSYAKGKVSSTYGYLDFVGGLVGRNRMGTIEYSYSTGLISPGYGSTEIGGLAGYNSGTFNQCFWDTQTSGRTGGVGGGSSTGVTGKMTAEMKTLTTFTSSPATWDFTNETAHGVNDNWRMCADNVDTPRLNWQSTSGDFACPADVAIDDLVVFIQRWLSADCTSSNNFCGGADIDISGAVNLADFAIFTAHWLEEM